MELVYAYGQESDSALQQEFLSGVREIAACAQTINIRVKIESLVQQSDRILDLDYSPEARAKLTAAGRDPAKRTIIREYALHGESMLQTGTDDRGNDFVVACNPVYAFGLQRPKGMKEYGIRFLEQVGIDPQVEQLIDQTSQEGLSMVFSGWSILGERLDTLVASKEFQIEKIATVDHGDSKLVRIDFQRRVADIRPGKLSFGDSYLLSDPKKQWGVVEYAVTILGKDGKPGLRREVHSVLQIVNSVPITTKMTGTGSLDGDPKIVQEGSTTFEILSTDVPQSEFLARVRPATQKMRAKCAIVVKKESNQQLWIA